RSIELSNRPPQWLDHLRHRCGDDEELGLVLRLRVALEDLGDGRALQSVAADVLDHPDYRDPVVIPASWVESLDAPADRVLARPVSPRHGLIDDDNRRRILRIRALEESTAQKRYAERLKVIAADARPGELLPLIARLVGMAVDSTQPETADAAGP